MKKAQPSIAVIGTGALGGYYGGRLLQAGYDLHFLCHSDGPVIRERGLIVESVGHPTIHRPARAYDEAEDMPRCDIVIVSLKTTANHLLPELLPPVVKPDGVVVVLQNGLNVEHDAAAAVPGVLVLGGLCFLCANKPEPGRILHLDYGHIVFGWYEETGDRESADQWLETVSTCFNNADIKTVVSPDLQLERWKKLVWNIPYNGMSVIHNTTTDVLMADPDWRKEIETLMHEVQSLASACNCIIEDEFVQKMLENTVKMQPYKTSMLLDYEVGKPLEIATMYEQPLLTGEAAGASAPHIRKLFRQLSETQN